LAAELNAGTLGKGEYAWFLLEQIEDGVMEIADNISLCDGHLNVYSRRVALKLYEIGILTESIMKDMVNDDYLDGFVDSKILQEARKPSAKIISFEPLLRSVFDVEKRTVLFRLFTYEKSFMPFSTFGSKSVSPGWWETYQHVKHDFFHNVAEASVKQLLEGSAAVFLLMMLCRIYWPALVSKHRITFGFMQQMVDRQGGWEQAYETLCDAIPARNGIRKRKHGWHTDILAKSRLFSATLAKWNLDKYEYEIPH